MKGFKLTRVDLTNEKHKQAFVEQMNCYITDPMGGGEPLNDIRGKELIKILTETPNYIGFFAEYDGDICGLMNCFSSVATFSIGKCLNIHDVVLSNELRGKGVGKAMFGAVIDYCKSEGYKKVTLEVREDNPTAQHVYKSFGFDECNPVMHFWTLKINE